MQQSVSCQTGHNGSIQMNNKPLNNQKTAYFVRQSVVGKECLYFV